MSEISINNIYGHQISDFVKGFVNLKGFVDLHPVIDSSSKITLRENYENSKSYSICTLSFDEVDKLYKMDYNMFTPCKEFSEVLRQFKEFEIDNVHIYEYEKYEIYVNGVKIHFVSWVDFSKDLDCMQQIGYNLINILSSLTGEEGYKLKEQFDNDFEKDFRDGKIKRFNNF